MDGSLNLCHESQLAGGQSNQANDSSVLVPRQKSKKSFITKTSAERASTAPPPAGKTDID